MRSDDEDEVLKNYQGERRIKLSRDLILPTETLKQVMKKGPPVADIVKDITKISEIDKMRKSQHESMQREAESIFKKKVEVRTILDANRMNRRKPMNSVGSSSEEDDAQQIYREILDVVKTNSPASLQCGRGRMVGYGEEVQDTMRRGDKNNAARCRSKLPTQHAFARCGFHDQVFKDLMFCVVFKNETF